MKKIMLVFGTRPEAIKMAPIIKELKKKSEIFKVFVCVTGQHREMLDQVLELFEITPDYDLDIMKSGQDLYDITSRILIGLRDVFRDVRPDIVLVHGDTTTSSTAALASFYQRIPVGHIEAGLRTYNIYSPWPEEINRQIISRIATYNFAPTMLSKQNLLEERISSETICITGNSVIDSLLWVVGKLNEDSIFLEKVLEQLKGSNLPINLIKSWGKDRKCVLITGHRRENFGEGFLNICKAIKELSLTYPNVDFVYPVHLNPSVQKPVYESLGNLSNVFLIKPLDYLPFVFLMKHAYLILTDSGGIQEEAPALGIPVLVMRDTTERPEGVEAGTVKLVGTDYDLIISHVKKLMQDKKLYDQMSQSNNPYGDGHASSRIVDFLM